MIHSDHTQEQYADTRGLCAQPVVPGKVLQSRPEACRFLVNDLLDVSVFDPGLLEPTSVALIDQSVKQRRLGDS
jgi:hypothetical protein